jgi:ferredoxin-thioredoxin reductase catalytic subunit
MTLSGDPAEDRLKICPCDRHHEDIARDGFCI